jgi:two-component sensor histidine kinase
MVGDNGKGLPEKIDTSKTLGWKRITLLTDQLRGKLEVDRDLPGTNIRIRF